MNVKYSLGVVAVAAILAMPAIGLATTTWSNKNVGTLQSMFDGADCFYFTLDGVTQADPIVPGSAWFAIPRVQYGAKDAYAMLLSAKLSERQLIVVTSGATSCGLAGVAQIYLP
jgi:hypothetical protein